MHIIIKKWIATVMGAGSTIALVILYQFPGRMGFFVTLAVWLIFLAVGEWLTQLGDSHHHRALHVLVVTSLSFVGLMTLIEWQALLWLLIILGGLTMFALFRTIISEGTLLSIKRKSIRRFMMLLWVFNTYALITTFYAINLFFSRLPFWTLVILSGILFAYTSYMIWSMYYTLQIKKTWLWLVIVGFVMVELVWVMHSLPFGYLATGFLVTWVWYLVQLFMRFHFSSKGVVWKKQRVFLITNLVLYIGVLAFFVRWV
jgi:hypothetical protein